MSWNVESTKSTFNASENVTNTIEGRDSVRSSAQVNKDFGAVGANFLKSGHMYSIVGINANKIPEMREAIRNYVSGIQKHLDGFQASADSSKAFKSEVVTSSVQKYMDTVKEYCQNLTSQLIAFSDKLKDVETEWLKATQNMSQSVNDSVSNFNKGSQYSEKL